LILHVGCGSIPASSILLAQKTKGVILGIDKDDYAVKQAKKFISHTNPSKHLEIKKGGPLDFDLCLFDVILISQGIVPKKQVLKALSTKITDEQIIILRSFSASSTIDEQDLFLSEYYTIQHVYQHTIHGSTISIFLKKKHI
jgi:precorrin-6B methylase 2